MRLVSFLSLLIVATDGNVDAAVVDPLGGNLMDSDRPFSLFCFPDLTSRGLRS